MRKLILALAAFTVLTAGCRLFRDDDHPSRSHYGPPTDVVTARR